MLCACLYLSCLFFNIFLTLRQRLQAYPDRRAPSPPGKHAFQDCVLKREIIIIIIIIIWLKYHKEKNNLKINKF